MDNIEKTINTIINDINKPKEVYKKRIHPISTVYEYVKTGSFVTDSYMLSSIEPLISSINLKTMITSIDTRISNLSTTDEKMIDWLSYKVNHLKNTIVSKIGSPKKEMNQDTLDATMIYIYYLGNLLPLLGSNKHSFQFKVNNNGLIVNNNTLQFEYLTMLWFLVYKMYKNIVEYIVDEQLTNEKYQKMIVNLNFCIDIIRYMIEHIEKLSTNGYNYKRFIYQTSPSSISNKTSSNYNKSIDEMEYNQRKQENNFIIHHFGGIRGLKARLYIFYAIKYQECFKRATRRINISDILDEEEYNFNDDDDDEGNNIHNKLEYIQAFTGIAKQISQYYFKANTLIVSSIKDIKNQFVSEREGIDTYTISCSHDETLEYLTMYRATYWLCVAYYIYTLCDYYIYSNTNNNIEKGKQSLKRIEDVREMITVFKNEYNIEDTTRKCIYDRSIINETIKLSNAIEKLYIKIHRDITVMKYRTSENVKLDEIKDSINEDRSSKSSLYTGHINLIHDTECGNEKNSDIKNALDILYQLKKVYITNMTTRISSHPPPYIFSSLSDKLSKSNPYIEDDNGIGNYNDNEQIDENNDVEYDILDIDEAKLQIAVSKERMKWVDYILSHKVVNNKGNDIIVIRDVDLLLNTKNQLLAINDTNNTIKETIKRNSLSLSTTSNNLLS